MSKKCKFNIDFFGKRKVFLIISLILVLVSIAMTFTGLNVAIEFKGGTIVSYEYAGELDRAKLDNILSERIQNSYNIQEGDSFESNKKTISISFAGGGKFNGTAASTSDAGSTVSDGAVISGDFTYTGENFTAVQQSELTNTLIREFPENQIVLQDSSNVNPSSGKTFFLKCITAVALASVIL
ncbi:MAG: hypothetical protein LBM93_03530, partial [Oscillospiraceae bacterium]|nr:hypothetical protein [Oscillospiraceae bacterium]